MRLRHLHAVAQRHGGAKNCEIAEDADSHEPVPGAGTSATGKVTEWASPSGAKSGPYGISAINDVIWYSESETTPNTVVRFNMRYRLLLEREAPTPTPPRGVVGPPRKGEV